MNARSDWRELLRQPTLGDHIARPEDSEDFERPLGGAIAALRLDYPKTRSWPA